MKKYLKFAGAVAFVFALVAFILLMATVGVYSKSGSLRVDFDGIVVLFGKTESTILGNAKTELAWTGLIAWILNIVAMLILCAGVVLPLLKVKALDKFAGVLNLVAVIALVAGGILLFFSAPAFAGANGVDGDNLKYYHLAAGWVVSGILAIVGGAVAILPAVVDFLGKKK